jgi:hypothetical protein
MSKPIVITFEEFLQLFEQETNPLEGSNLLQTPDSMVIRCILRLHGKDGLIPKLKQDLITTHPELRHRPAKPQVGTFEIYEASWGDLGQNLFCLICYSSPLTNRHFHYEMLLGPLEDRREMERQAQAIVDRPWHNVDHRPGKN